MKEPQPCFIALRVRDIQESLAFYKDVVGLPLNPAEDGSHFECSWHKPYFHFAIFPAERTVSNTWVGFAVDDLDSIYARIVSKRLKVLSEPKKEPWGYSADYEDPDGNRVNLTVLSKA